MFNAAQKKSTAAARIDDDPLLVFTRIRDMSLALCASLEIEDCVVQSMPDASPLKWHLAHTTWFFEQFILKPFLDDYRPFDAHYEYLFNSYYHQVGSMHERAARGVVSRPTVAETIRYRRYVDESMQNLLARPNSHEQLSSLLALGLNHEQQHQELMLTDIKHAFSRNPALPAYRPRSLQLVTFDDETPAAELQFVAFEGGIQMIGAVGDGFSFDNEGPRHRVLVAPFSLANRLVTNGEYLQFIRDGGYRHSEHWLADGWDIASRERWSRPLYWQESLDSEFTLHGVMELGWGAPVSHLSYYEADAFARWAGKRLPTEFEWEAVASGLPLEGNLSDSEFFCPLPAKTSTRTPVQQLFGDVWEWTSSAHAPFPGYRPPAGALGEYNGKFMSDRMVLRGGSCVTPNDHIRASYRNYFAPHARWQFSGVRLAQ